MNDVRTVAELERTLQGLEPEPLLPATLAGIRDRGRRRRRVRVTAALAGVVAATVVASVGVAAVRGGEERRATHGPVTTPYPWSPTTLSRLARRALAALGVLAFFQAWTAFTWPLIVSSTKTAYTIEVGLALFQTGFTVDVGRLSAASSVVLIPSVTLFVLLRRHFVQGVASTGLKE